MADKNAEVAVEDNGGMKKTLSLWNFFTIGFGAIIGTGWVLQVGDWMVVGGGPVPAMIAFLLGAIFLVPVGAVFGELTAAIPISGGIVEYVDRSFGRTLSYITGWLLALGNGILCPWEAIAISSLLATMWSRLDGFGWLTGVKLYDMIGLDYNDPKWDELLDQMTFDEMNSLIGDAFHWTMPVKSVEAPGTRDENGPQGLTAALTGGASAMCYTSEDVMAATFNVDLINEVGKCIGEDCLAMGYSGLYGPGINMHRTAYSGRNFEYYAEDPFVAGTICAAEVQGIQSKGVYVYLKHVALNDSETSRRGVNTWLNEQTAREIYLEVADKAITDGGAWSVMTGFNRWGATWCGANANLLNGFLREELGMRGMCITDFSGSSQYMDLVDGLIAGSDIWDSPMPKIHTTKAANYENDAYIVTQMRNAMHHILYTVVNSRAYDEENLNPGMAKWKVILIGADVVAALLIVGLEYTAIKNYKKRKEEEEEV